MSLVSACVTLVDVPCSQALSGEGPGYEAINPGVVRVEFNPLPTNDAYMRLSVLFFHKSIRIYMEVIILGANTLYSVFCFFKALLPKQVWSGMVGKGINC